MFKQLLIVFALAASLFASGCSTMRALGQVDQIDSVRSTLVDYLPEYQLRSIQDDLDLLDHTYAEVKKIVSINADISATGVILAVLGAPEAFDDVGDAYDGIYKAVRRHNYHFKKPIPANLIAFDEAMQPAYAELKTAINANDRARLGIEVLKLLRPLVALVI